MDMTLSAAEDFQDKERNLDWLTALFPILIMAVYYYRWAAVLVPLLALAGYVAGAVLLQWAKGMPCRVLPGTVTALLIGFCLPSSVPLWLPALAGCVAALIEAVPLLVGRRWPGRSLARPLLHPALTGVLAVGLLFPTLVQAVTVPAMWSGSDGATVSSLAGLFDPSVAVERIRLFFGVYPGKMGQTCAPVILLAAAFLLLRRRLRLIAPACMLAVVSLLSWAVWDSPLYGVLAGGTLLSALLLADRTVAPAGYGSQITAGVLAGGMTVLLRYALHTDGTVPAVLLACVLSPLYPLLGRELKRGFGVVFAFLQNKLGNFQKNAK